LLIAGTYTPFGLVIVDGKLGQSVLIAIWLFAIFGILAKLVFRERFAADSSLGALNWPPIARLPRTPDVKIYDPAQAEHAAGDRQTAIDIIPE